MSINRIVKRNLWKLELMTYINKQWSDLRLRDGFGRLFSFYAQKKDKI